MNSGVLILILICLFIVFIIIMLSFIISQKKIALDRNDTIGFVFLLSVAIIDSVLGLLGLLS